MRGNGIVESIDSDELKNQPKSYDFKKRYIEMDFKKLIERLHQTIHLKLMT